MAKSLLLNFLELVGVLSVNPEQYGRKIEDLRTLFINAHHLLNEYRPHQARETLILMMEEQLARSRAETDGIRNMKEKVDSILDGLGEQVDGLQAQQKPALLKDTVAGNQDGWSYSICLGSLGRRAWGRRGRPANVMKNKCHSLFMPCIYGRKTRVSGPMLDLIA